MRLSIDIHLSFGKDDPAVEQHDSDHTGYLVDSGRVVGFQREGDE